jgi:anti-sigma regulatory factor (Ser/Thr protein kinase)
VVVRLPQATSWWSWIAGDRGIQRSHSPRVLPDEVDIMNPMNLQAARPSYVSRLALAALPGSVATARRHVRHVLHLWEFPQLIDTVELVVSELGTNAVKATGLMTDDLGYGALRHGLRAICVRLSMTGQQATVEVWDSSPALPRLDVSGPDAEGGRGLFLVAALSKAWGVHRPVTGGKVVWAVIEN